MCYLSPHGDVYMTVSHLPSQSVSYIVMLTLSFFNLACGNTTLNTFKQ